MTTNAARSQLRDDLRRHPSTIAAMPVNTANAPTGGKKSLGPATAANADAVSSEPGTL